MSKSNLPVRRPVTDADLMAFIDGVLDEDRRVDVLDYIADHPEAAARVEAYLHQNANLRLLGQALDLSDERVFCPKLQAELVQALRQRPQRRWSFSSAWPAWALAAGVALAVGLAGVLSEIVPKAAPKIAEAPASEAAPVLPAGVVTAAAGTEPSGEAQAPPYVLFDSVTPDPYAGGEEGEATVTWLRERLAGRTFARPDLSSLGLDFKGGRIFKTSRVPAISLAYEDEMGRPLYLYVAMLSEGASGHMLRLVPEDRVSMMWRQGPLALAVVAPQDSPGLVDAMRQVRTALSGGNASTAPSPVVPEPAEAPVQTLLLPSEPTGAFVVPMPRPDRPSLGEPNGVEPLPATPEVMAVPVSNQPEPL